MQPSHSLPSHHIQWSSYQLNNLTLHQRLHVWLSKYFRREVPGKARRASTTSRMIREEVWYGRQELSCLASRVEKHCTYHVKHPVMIPLILLFTIKRAWRPCWCQVKWEVQQHDGSTRATCTTRVEGQLETGYRNKRSAPELQWLGASAAAATTNKSAHSTQREAFSRLDHTARAAKHRPAQ